MRSPDDFLPVNPDFESFVRASFARQGLMITLGARMGAVAPGRVVIEVPFADGVSQQKGFFHGAVLGGIGDSAGGYAALTLLPAGSEVVSIEYKINFLKPAVGDLLRATGRVVRSGRSISVCQIDVDVIAAANAARCGVMQATFMRVEA
jgi:uncharacterized protein (TIGR00369 family)